MGSKAVEPKLYLNFSLDAAIPEKHIVRRLAAAVDFGFVRSLVNKHYSHTGQPSVDPVVLFKLWLLGYLFNIRSERRLCEEASLNLAWRWFLGYELDEAIVRSLQEQEKLLIGQEQAEALKLEIGNAVTTINAAVTWRYLDDGANGPTIEANLQVPERRMKIKLTIHKNTDNSLAASHLIEIKIDARHVDFFYGASGDDVASRPFRVRCVR